jgi:hypothetical protein
MCGKEKVIASDGIFARRQTHLCVTTGKPKKLAKRLLAYNEAMNKVSKK